MNKLINQILSQTNLKNLTRLNQGQRDFRNLIILHR